MQLTSADIVWRNARLATFDPARSEPYGMLDQHDLILRDGRIIALLPCGAVSGGTIHDAGGRLITPGLIDCHTHLVFAGNRAAEWEQRLNGVSYQEISAQGGGINASVAATRQASESELFTQAVNRLHHLLHEGVTTLEIKSGYGLTLQSEAKMLRVIGQLAKQYPVEISPTLLAAHTTPAEYRNDKDGYISLICEAILPQLWKEGLFEAVDVFCESVGFSPQQCERIFATAQHHGIPVKGHVEQLSLLGGAQLVSRYQGLSADHIEYIDEKGVEMMSKSGTVAVLLPGAFYFLREPCRPPVDLLRQYNVPIAIATDYNPGTSPFISLHMAMNMACVQFGLTPEETWNGVTRNAAQALGRAHSHGQLSAGFMADLAIWDAEQPVEIIYEPCHSPLYARVFRGCITHGGA